MKKLIERLRDYTYAGDSWLTQQEAADEIERLAALLGEERAISDALALRVDELKAELGDLPESQREMMAEIKRLKAEVASNQVGFTKVSPYEPGSRGRFSI